MLVLYQATQDRATEIQFGVDSDCPPNHLGLRYKIDEKWYDMSPYPQHIHRGLESCLCEMSGCPEDSVFPLEGVIEGPCFDLDLKWQVRIEGPKIPYTLTRL
jgi:hypothetical protein